MNSLVAKIGWWTEQESVRIACQRYWHSKKVGKVKKVSFPFSFSFWLKENPRGENNEIF